MKQYWKKFTVCLSAATAIILCLPFSAFCAERIVILAPAAADIVSKLGCENEVVGVTDSIDDFQGATRVGTHINPCIECIAALSPTLLVTTERFPSELAKKLNAEQFVYAPKDMIQILGALDNLGKRLGKSEKASSLITYYSGLLKKARPVEFKPTVIFETRSNPLTLAGENTIYQDVLERAGMEYVRAGFKTGPVSAEYVAVSKVDYYIYQVGPMNENPTPPKQRTGFKKLKSCVWKFDEKIFSRPNTNLFYEVLKINTILNSEKPCSLGLEEGYKP